MNSIENNNKDDYRNIMEVIKNEMGYFLNCAEKGINVPNSSKKARKLSIKLTKLLKDYRKTSVINDKVIREYKKHHKNIEKIENDNVKI